MGKRAHEEARSETDPLLAPALASAALVVAASFETGPLGFLPLVLRVPLVLAALAAFWRQPISARGFSLPGWAAPALEGLGLLLVLGTWGLLKVVGLHASDTDDNIYFYLAQRVAQGAVPYRDFFFAHPPVHLLIPAAVFKVVGFSVPVAKALPVLAQTGAALCLYLALRPAGRPFALVALMLHLTAYEVLMGSTDLDGENLMTLMLCAGLLAASRRQALVAGILCGLALGTGLYALAGVLALALAFAGRSRREAGAFLLGLVGCVALWCAVFGGLGGQAFWDGVFRYHFAKAPSGDKVSLFASANPLTFASTYLHNLGAFLGSRTFGKSVYFHSGLYVAAGVGVAWAAVVAQRALRGGGGKLFAALRARLSVLLSGSGEGLVLLAGLGAILYLLQWAALNEVYDFYMVPQLVLMAVPAAWVLVRLAAWIGEATRPQALLVPVGLAGLLGFHTPLGRAVHDGLWPDEVRDRGVQVQYSWRDPEVLTGAARLTRALFFETSRSKGEPTPAYRHYLWNKSLSFSVAGELAAYVAANTGPEETLVGASASAPLVALLAGRRLAGDEADTNQKRFRAGLLTDEAYWAEACADRVRFVLAAPRSHFTEQFMAQDPTARRWFVREREFVDAHLRHFRTERFALYRRRDDPAPPGRVCEPVGAPSGR